jgi:hypothetical protein
MDEMFNAHLVRYVFTSPILYRLDISSFANRTSFKRLTTGNIVILIINDCLRKTKIWNNMLIEISLQLHFYYTPGDQTESVFGCIISPKLKNRNLAET